MAKPRRSDRQRYWREVIERQQANGQSIVGVYSQEELAPASFHAWKRRLCPRRGTGRTSVKQALVPVEIVDESAGAVGRLEIQWPSGVVLRVQGCEAATIGTVVATISVSSKRRTRRC
jgi:hypothetical protein